MDGRGMQESRQQGEQGTAMILTMVLLFIVGCCFGSSLTWFATGNRRQGYIVLIGMGLAVVQLSVRLVEYFR